MTSKNKNNDPYAVLRSKDFLFFLGSRFFLTLALQIQGVVIGWQVYQYTKDVLALGMIGLAEVIPYFVTSLFSGHISDNYNRKTIILISNSCLFFLTAGLLFFSMDTTLYSRMGAIPIYLLIGCTGILRGFLASSLTPLMTQLVPRTLYANAVTWNSSVWHTGVIIGPSIAGILCSISFPIAYKTNMVFILIAVICLLFIASYPAQLKEKKETLKESLLAGLKFVFKNKLLLNILLLDFFVILFGGALAMLPVFADKIYGTGAKGLGFLSAMPALGGIITAVIIAYNPLTKNAGRNLIVSVAGFGIVTILFAVSTNYYFGLFFLLLIGAFNNVIAVIRQTIIQLLTPGNMQGRVASVNSIFNGSSTEIGAFESGVAARFMGLVPSVVFGGAMTLVVAIITIIVLPRLVKLNISHIQHASPETTKVVEVTKVVVEA